MRAGNRMAVFVAAALVAGHAEAGAKSTKLQCDPGRTIDVLLRAMEETLKAHGSNMRLKAVVKYKDAPRALAHNEATLRRYFNRTPGLTPYAPDKNSCVGICRDNICEEVCDDQVGANEDPDFIDEDMCEGPLNDNQNAGPITPVDDVNGGGDDLGDACDNLGAVNTKVADATNNLNAIENALNAAPTDEEVTLYAGKGKAGRRDGGTRLGKVGNSLKELKELLRKIGERIRELERGNGRKRRPDGDQRKKDGKRGDDKKRRPSPENGKDPKPPTTDGDAGGVDNGANPGGNDVCNNLGNVDDALDKVNDDLNVVNENLNDIGKNANANANDPIATIDNAVNAINTNLEVADNELAGIEATLVRYGGLGNAASKDDPVQWGALESGKDLAAVFPNEPKLEAQCTVVFDIFASGSLNGKKIVNEKIATKTVMGLMR